MNHAIKSTRLHISGGRSKYATDLDRCTIDAGIKCATRSSDLHIPSIDEMCTPAGVRN